MIKRYSSITFIGVVSLLCTFIVTAHDSNSHTAPWQSCETKKVAQSCEYTNGKNDLYKGTCQTFNNARMCVRNQPIIYSKSNVENVKLFKNFEGNIIHTDGQKE